MSTTDVPMSEAGNPIGFGPCDHDTTTVTFCGSSTTQMMRVSRVAPVQ